MKKKKKLSQSFQRRLIVLVAIAFLATTAFLWLIQTRLSENNAINLLRLNLADGGRILATLRMAICSSSPVMSLRI